ncbi:response regulator transcription factor [Radiobacillus kanasensis]|uniref:response regulator transcription factor n=1 Tax=Radiobacillus kanasensis TaxID=2844358 RepID=UPI001E46A11A|nr:response regulator transcription factor [Radiobacillus kanasensis]UFU00152.1 response regulator transcription factor [Radiobacillus kanasensis]
MSRIYLVEDDPKIAELLREYLERYDYELQIAQDFNAILEEFEAFQPELVLLDINLPRFDGFYWCRKIRTVSKCPIIFISARDSGMDQVMAIENGGDDYITKPFEFEVVLAKVKSLMRRVYGEYAVEQNTNYIERLGLILHIDAMEMEYNDMCIPLSKKEFLLLKEFMQNENQVLHRNHLLEILWDDQNFVDDNTLSVNVTRLRKKLEELSRVDAIQTVRGAGYKFVADWSSES